MKRSGARKATVGLYVAIVGLVTAVVALLAALVRLAATGVTALVERIPRRAPMPKASATPKATEKLALRLVPSKTEQPAQAERLTVALTGMGFAAPAVRRFVSSLGPRVEREDLGSLIKDGLRALAA